jgi:hypothetical protein
MLLLVVNVLTNVLELQVMALERAAAEGQSVSKLRASVDQHRSLSIDILMYRDSADTSAEEALINKDSHAHGCLQDILLRELRNNAADFIEVIGETKKLMPGAESTLCGDDSKGGTSNSSCNSRSTDEPVVPTSTASADEEADSRSGLSVESLVLCGHIVLLLFLQQSARRLQRSASLSSSVPAPPSGYRSSSSIEIAPQLPGGSWYVPMRLLTAFLALHGKVRTTDTCIVPMHAYIV